ncbi:MAG: c-type cytochrome [Chitinophagaceae bacterium]|nr:MAG: c-type cytochrome [Chitinophagaceae bacterium]
MKVIVTTCLLISTVLMLSFSLEQSRSKKKRAAALGKVLFSEKLLSRDSSVSCASCHKPDYAFADTVAFSVGIFGKLTSRNTPSVLNMKNRPYYFWDGRAASLHEQSLIPIENPDEMGLPVAKAFGQRPNAKNLALAIAAFEETLETVDSKFDDWANNLSELSEAEERGRELFVGNKAKCFDCHSMEDFTDDEFKNIGLFNGRDLADIGRFGITGVESDKGKFKTPGLRNVGVTAPYMHDGRFKTLEQVVAYYNTPFMFVDDPVNMDSLLLRPLRLTPAERSDLVAFLKTLTDKAFLK